MIELNLIDNYLLKNPLNHDHAECSGLNIGAVFTTPYTLKTAK